MAAIADPTVASSVLTRRARDAHPALPAGPPMAMQRENHTLLEEWAYQRFDGAEAERTGVPGRVPARRQPITATTPQLVGRPSATGTWHLGAVSRNVVDAPGLK